GEAQAAATALAKYDLRDVAASLQEQSNKARMRDYFREWEAERKLRWEQLQKQAQDLLDKNSPLLTSVHRKSLDRIVQLTLNETASRAEHDLKYWGERLRTINWRITPGVKEWENAVTVTTRQAQRVKNAVQDVSDPKQRAAIVLQAIGIAQAALDAAAKATRQ